MGQATVSFRTSDEVAQNLEQLYAHFYRSSLRLETGKRLKKQHILAALVAHASSLSKPELEFVVKRGLELSQISYSEAKPET